MTLLAGRARVFSAELLTNPCFSAWTTDDPDGWTVAGETGVASEISEVGKGQGHGDVGTGYCNLFVLDAIVDTVEISQDILVLGNKYYCSINVDTVLEGGIYITENDNVVVNYTTAGVRQFTFTATETKFAVRSNRGGGIIDDVTIGCVSVIREV